MNKKGGFTLIELLVVIAIIGILSSVVLVSLNSARQKGKDARIISDVQQTRTILESGYNGSAYPDLNGGNANCNGSGASVNVTTVASNANCTLAAGPGSATINQLYTDATGQGGNLFYSVNPNNGAYAIRGQLVSNAALFFCIDSTGRTNASDNNVSNAVAQCH